MKLIERVKRSDQLVMVIGFLLIGSLFYFLTTKILLGKVFIVTSLSLTLIFLSSSFLSRLVLTLWFQLAIILGWINSRILLTIVFFVILFPVALISRIFSKDPLKLIETNDGTFVTRNHKYTAQDMVNPW